MSYSQLTAYHCNEITQIEAMTDVRKQRPILFVDGLPIVAMHLGIVKILPLYAPCFAIDLVPFSTRVETHGQLRHVNRSLSDFNRTIRSDNPPRCTSTSSSLIKQFLLVVRE